MQQVSGLFQLLSFRKESNQICPVTGLVIKGWRNAWESGIPHKAAPYFSLFAWCHAKHKRCSAPLKSVFHFFCVAQKKWTKEKGTAARGLSGEFLAPALPDAAVARVVSRSARRFR
ncbi:MAG TPA: hypothetical protein PK158_14295 [Spirochaetota bacterium]|nr:hypothetical protein [Spirochaetota bacterium]